MKSIALDPDRITGSGWAAVTSCRAHLLLVYVSPAAGLSYYVALVGWLSTTPLGNSSPRWDASGAAG
ncbi:MAG: hypothetical protein JO287_14525 [Pseudonocardiales bacterium]|nr:hypothetical protein [Pseudonocardiales bacterium]